LESGAKIGPYTITRELGRGGMGVVYLGRDTRLDRDVAIKALPEHLASDPDRLARFGREAKTLAQLNHPNVAGIYGIEEHEGARYLVLEYVEGETLAQRLDRGALPPDEATDFAIQIAEGVEAAHEAGVIHRDLKPGNVIVTPDGKAKVLDFGLARAEESSSSTSFSPTDPTITSPANHSPTMPGVILGTAAYMSPEQARGRKVDKRTDIWSFGVMLYEMLTGASPFIGETVSDSIGAVLHKEVNLDLLPPATPANTRRLIRRCLMRDRTRRLQSIGDARVELLDVEEEPATPGGSPGAARRTRAFPWLLAGGLGMVGGALLWALVTQVATSADAWGRSSVVRSWIPLPEGKTLSAGNSVAISRDGSMLALSVGLDENAQIYLRRLDEFEMEPIPGTEGAQAPFFSPDGEQLGFLAGGRLKKVLLRGTGRQVSVLCDAQVSGSGAWDRNGWIYFTSSLGRLARVREDGGTPQELGNAGDVYHVSALPEGRGILLTIRTPEAQSNRKDTCRIAVLSPDARTVKPVLDGGYNARYLSSGQLVFIRSGALFAVPFDLDSLEASSSPISVQPEVWTDSVWAIARYDVSLDGTLAYIDGGDAARTVPTWINLETREEQPLPIPPGVYNTFNLSPDGTQLAIQNASGAKDQIYIYDANRGTFTRLTEDGANVYPAWSHDGREVFFASSRDGKGYLLYRQPVDGSAPATRLLTDEQEAIMETEQHWPSSVTPDGNYLLAFSWAHPTRGGDLWKVPLDGSGGPEVVLATPANEVIPQVSPDGKWLAYLSDQYGDYQIMVRPFPDVQRRVWVVSGDDSVDPRWSSSGDALLFRRGWGRLMKVSVGDGDEFVPGVAQELMEIDFHDSAGSSFAVSPDGKRLLVNKPVNVSYRDRTPVTLITGWGGEVLRKFKTE